MAVQPLKNCSLDSNANDVLVSPRASDECEVLAEGDTKRRVTWKNTNRLLEDEGCDGVKTGTTNAAGACLVASAHRGDDHLIVVVLGSTNGDGRYEDVRKLLRWAREQRQDKKPEESQPRQP
jgi:D-alanyl-D-alanine carboxypeptidase (penicillin-binding protein 5/6)